MTANQRITQWFAGKGWQPFHFQRQVWRAYEDGQDGLIHAATGTGKTLAAWLGPVREYLRSQSRQHDRSSTRHRGEPLRVLWLTPLRALAADTVAALQEPIRDLGLPWTIERRTGDTSASLRARQRKRLPTALVTTPESFSVLLSRAETLAQLATLQCVVVDEWHELLGSKRGVQTELCLARVRRLVPSVRVWAVSATLGNLAEAARIVVGPSRRQPRMITGQLARRTEIRSLIPERVDLFPWAGHMGTALLPQVIKAIESASTSLMFTNTRSQAENWYRALLHGRPGWSGAIGLHHGSIDRDQRKFVEARLAGGKLRCVVCTSSLDLGVDFSPVEQVLQVGSPKGIARLLQRAGRSGHQPGGLSRLVFVPTHAWELIEVAATREGLASGSMESRHSLAQPLDVLVQHLVTVAAGGGFTPDETLTEIRDTAAYHDLTDAEWSWALDFVTRGGPTLTAYPEFRRVVQKDGCFVVDDQRIARRHRMAIGTISSDAALTVKYVTGGRLGTVEESFIGRLEPGDRFTFAGRQLQLVRVRDMTAWVRRAPGRTRVVPRWMGGRMPLSTELAAAVRTTLHRASLGDYGSSKELRATRDLLRLQARWSLVPRQRELLVERNKTRDGHHLFFYPFEGRMVHEGLSALLAWRLAQRRPATFSISVNDYGFELLSDSAVVMDAEVLQDLLCTEKLVDDILQSLNSTELARRQFRDIARIAGLVFAGFPGQGKSTRQLQVSSNLFFDVFREFDPQHLLLAQAHAEVLQHQLEQQRMHGALLRVQECDLVITDPPRPTPLAFPLIVDRLRARLSTEQLSDRISRMQLQFEKAARK